MHTNRLAQEKSPYLLQHAHNPVDWMPWGAEAFEKARAENKPIFLSIGYSTCHWCHVMERESFENEDLAAILNRDYISIKVDREERPDVDRIYMTFVQSTTGSGGWPMSVWLTPDLQPFYGGTYYPPENRWGTPGFGSVLKQIAAAWQADREKIEQSARDVMEQLRKQVTVEGGRSGGASLNGDLLQTAFHAFRRNFDSRTGGFGGAPKFPRPSVFNFLLRYRARTRDKEALDMTLLTLREMARGGMNDQLGGGFHRYSVDDRWFVPHFEKMLYDQAQLATSYVEAFQITGDQQYAGVARHILDYVLRDMTAPEGAFYSAEDADSVIDPAQPHDKGEGAFYIWSAEELKALLGNAAPWFIFRYGASEHGNVDHDPHAEFTGRNILFAAHTVEQTAQKFGEPQAEVQTAVDKAVDILMKARSQRVRPHLDDKILAAWNGLMISAFALAGAALNEPRYSAAARNAANFIAGTMYNPADRTLLRRYRAGDAAIPGFIDDYTMFAQALFDLYETQFDLAHLQLALELTDETIKRFGDASGAGFYSSAEGGESAILRIKDDYDGAEPAGNSIALMNLLRASRFTNNPAKRELVVSTLQAFLPRLSLAPAALPQMLAAVEFFMSEPREIVLVGDLADSGMQELLRALHSRFIPSRAVMLIDSPRARAFFAAAIPTVEPMQMQSGRASAYVCRNYACQLPVTGADEFAALLQ